MSLEWLWLRWEKKGMGIWLWELWGVESLLACSPLYKSEYGSCIHMSIHHLPHLVDNTSLRWEMMLAMSQFLSSGGTYDRILFDALCGFVFENQLLFVWILVRCRLCVRNLCVQVPVIFRVAAWISHALKLVGHICPWSWPWACLLQSCKKPFIGPPPTTHMTIVFSRTPADHKGS